MSEKPPEENEAAVSDIPVVALLYNKYPFVDYDNFTDLPNGSHKWATRRESRDEGITRARSGSRNTTVSRSEKDRCTTSPNCHVCITETTVIYDFMSTLEFDLIKNQ